MKKAKLQEKLQQYVTSDKQLFVELYLQFKNENGELETILPPSEEQKLSQSLSQLVRNS